MTQSTLSLNRTCEFLRSNYQFSEGYDVTIVAHEGVVLVYVLPHRVQRYKKLVQSLHEQLLCEVVVRADYDGLKNHPTHHHLTYKRLLYFWK
jgi:hypothetical protein